MSWLNRIALGYKIALAPALVAVLLVIVTAVSAVGSSRTRAVVQDLAEQKLPRIASTGALSERVAHLNSMFMQSIAYEGVGLKAETIGALDQRIVGELDALSKEIAAMQAAAGTQPEMQASLRAVATAFKTYRGSVADTLDMKSMGLASTYGVMARSEASYAELRRELASMAASQVKAGDELAKQAGAGVSATISTALVLTAVAIGVSGVITWWITRMILRPLRRAVAVARTVASGDLTSRIEEAGRDEVGQLVQALQDMNSSLRHVVERVRAGSDSIATGSAEIALGSTDLSRRTEQQASSLQQTAASMEQLGSTVKHNSEKASTAAQLATRASHAAAQGGEVVDEVVSTMGEISAASAKITEIVSVIDGIAFQTNILALNAAVEAARAGERGRGFAVVASEVRALAQRSAAAAGEIKALIGASADKVEAGSRLVGRAGSAMSDIVAQVKSVSELIDEINDATHEQTRGIEQIGGAVTSLDEMTQQNAALVEQSAAASESLQQQAASLVQAVGAFKVV